MSLAWPFKDPDEVLDYSIDWSARMPSDDHIVTSTWPSLPSGITVDSDEQTNTTTTLWLSGGTLGQSYSFTNRVVTLGGRTMDQTVTIKVKQK
jgi:hypothetical protein